jgi:DNA-binding transcriptional ArsR family regulator
LTRRRVLLLLLDGPSSPNELRAAIETGQPNLSNHLACLRGCGLVTARRERRRMRDALASGRLAHALADLAGGRLDRRMARRGDAALGR